MIEKKVIVNSSVPKKIIEILEAYNDEKLKFKYIGGGASPLEAGFQVFTDIEDNEKLIRKVKDVVRADKFGSVLFFQVLVP